MPDAEARRYFLHHRSQLIIKLIGSPNAGAKSAGIVASGTPSVVLTRFLHATGIHRIVSGAGFRSKRCVGTAHRSIEAAYSGPRKLLGKLLRLNFRNERSTTPGNGGRPGA